MKFTRSILFPSMLLACAALSAQTASDSPGSLNREILARAYFGADAPWFLNRIPFLEIDDPEIQQIYYYRWKVFRSHIREIGPQGTTVLEFLPDVPWAREPYTDLNDSASFHLREGRWLRDPSVVDDLIDHEYTGGGNDRHFSESIAAATVDTTLVTGDPAPALRHLDTHAAHLQSLGRSPRPQAEPILDRTADGRHRIHHRVDRCLGRGLRNNRRSGGFPQRLHRRLRIPAIHQHLPVRQCPGHRAPRNLG